MAETMVADTFGFLRSIYSPTLMKMLLHVRVYLKERAAGYVHKYVR